MNAQRTARFKSPLAALGAGFSLGILWGRWLPSTPGIHTLLIGSATLILIGLILLRADCERTAVCFVLVSMIFTGAADANRWANRFPTHHVSQLASLGVKLDAPLKLTGRVVSTPVSTGHGSLFDLEVQRVESGRSSVSAQGKVRLRVQGFDERNDSSGKSQHVQFGDTIEAIARLYPPHTYQNPGGFNFRTWMNDIEDLYWVGTVQGARQLEIINPACGLHIDEVIERTRRRLLRAIDDLYPPWSPEGRNGSVLKAVLWGDRTALDSSTLEDFRKTGLYHLLVVAGLHIGLITLLVELLLLRTRLRKLSRAVIVLAFLVVYAMLVEQRAPTLRATLMIAMYLLARILDRGHTPLNSLGGVALILLYARPAWLFDSGFQLSFSAALLIVGVAVPILERTAEPFRRALRQIDNVLLDDYFSPRMAQMRLDLRAAIRVLRRRIGLLRRFPSLSRFVVIAPLRCAVWSVNILLFSSVLQLGLMLPMVEIFHRVTFAGVGLNALAIPLMTALLALALPINLLAVASPTLAAWPAKLLSLVMAVLFKMTHLPGLAAWLSYRVPAPPAYIACGFCVAFVMAGYTLRYSHRWAAWALAVCAIFVGLIAFVPFSPRLPLGALQVTALDCGQGDATFLVLPDGTTILVDAGGTHARSRGFPSAQRWNAGEDIVSPYLWWRGLKRIDVVVVTNSSESNIEAVRAVLTNFSVGEIWYVPKADGQSVDPLLDSISMFRIPTRMLLGDDQIQMGPASIRFIQHNSGQPEAEAPTLQVDFNGARCAIAAGTVTVEQREVGEIERANDPGLRFVNDDSTGLLDRNSDVARRTRVAIFSPHGESGFRLNVPNQQHESRNGDGLRVFRTNIDGATSVESRDGSVSVCTSSNPRGEILKSIGWKINASAHTPCKP